MIEEKPKTVKPSASTASRTRAIAYVAMTIAIIAVSAWVTVPIGPVPFTLQMFAVTFALLILKPKQAIAAIAGYLALGAIGVPVFSGMRGGVGVLMGPTGGFLWGSDDSRIDGHELYCALTWHDLDWCKKHDDWCTYDFWFKEYCS